MNIIAPSILSADFTKLGEELKNIEKAGADWVHIDVMDGHFVPNITYGPIIVEACKRASNLIKDVHLMIEKPDLSIPDFAKAGADYISVHVEASPHLHRSIQLIKNFGIKAGVALNPATPLSSIEYVMEEVDFILIMSVNPGFGGQKFIESSIEKIEKLSKILRERRLSTIIQVDGGINLNTIVRVAKAGASSFVAGSAIFSTEDYKKTILDMKQASDMK
jgi:ribulose-phosphate 3-epimerase